jgi:hypothetical protein
MAEYRTEVAFARRRFEWGAIWGGVFCFIAIMTVFGALGLAIFATVAHPAASKFDMGLGIGIYSIVLTVVAMFIAGSATGRLAGVPTRLDGFYHGLVLYGLVLVCAFVLASLGSGLLVGTAAAGNAVTGGAAAENAANAAQNAVNNAAGTLGSYTRPYLFNVLITLGWGGFVALFLAFCAAVAGAMSSVAPRVVEREVREIRPAA